jgi:hypothetical protein
MVEQATAATHSLRMECDRLVELMGRFALGKSSAPTGDRDVSRPASVQRRRAASALGLALVQKHDWMEI